MNITPSKDNSDVFEIQEKFNPALISALYNNFKDPIQAILEILDNAVDDLIKNKTMLITVMPHKDKLSIINKGGSGMGKNELSEFFEWGLSKKRGKLGRYGQGGKAAMGYLGKSWQIQTTKAGSDVEYSVVEKDWDDRTGGLKKYIPEIKDTQNVEEGVVKIDISNLKRKISKNDLSQTLSRFYRPLMKSGQVEIYIGINERISSFEFPLELQEENFEIPLSNGKGVTGWLGILKRGSKIRGGIRCYCFGRLITEKEFFGQKEPSFKQSIDRLIGEIYINLEEIPLMMNKSDFDRGSSVWQEIKENMFDKIDPYIKLLLEERDQDLPTETEKKTIQKSAVIWADFLRYLQYAQKQGNMPGLPIDYGQKPREATHSTGEKIKKPDESMPETKRGPNNPATPPPLENVGKRKRTGAYPEPILRPLSESIRYQLAEEDGKKVLIINTSFSLYKLRKNQLSLYAWETLAFEYARDEDKETQNVGDYIIEMNELLFKLGEFIRKKGIKVS